MANPFRARIINATDPEGLGRVMISSLASKVEPSVWAQVLRPDPAAPATAYKLGDIVLVLLDEGDSNFPIIVGALSSRG